MKILVTAGNTLVPIDHVRAITNIFKGKTGAAIAGFLVRSGADVKLVTSNPDSAPKINALTVLPYKTYADLAAIMERQIRFGTFDVVIHSAAVSDYSVSHVCVEDAEGRMVAIDASQKVASTHSKLFLELSPTEKLIDKIRSEWDFSGTLIKFKLEVGKSPDELTSIARASLQASQADYIVANCLEWFGQSAIIIGSDGTHEQIERADLPQELWRKINAKNSARCDR